MGAFHLRAAIHLDRGSAGWPSLPRVFWIVVCMMLARSAGMAFNRWAEAKRDAAESSNRREPAHP